MYKRFEAHQVFVVGGDHAGVDHPVAVGVRDGLGAGRGTGGIVVAHFGPGPQLNRVAGVGRAGDIGLSVPPPARDAQVQQVPAFVFIEGQAGEAELHARLAVAEEGAARGRLDRDERPRPPTSCAGRSNCC